MPSISMVHIGPGTYNVSQIVKYAPHFLRSDEKGCENSKNPVKDIKRFLALIVENELPILKKM